jgi:hypothetical protein
VTDLFVSSDVCSINWRNISTSLWLIYFLRKQDLIYIFTIIYDMLYIIWIVRSENVDIYIYMIDLSFFLLFFFFFKINCISLWFIYLFKLFSWLTTLLGSRGPQWMEGLVHSVNYVRNFWSVVKSGFFRKSLST